MATSKRKERSTRPGARQQAGASPAKAASPPVAGPSVGILGQLLDEGRLEEAAQRCRAALERVDVADGDPSARPRLHHNLAVILYRLGRFDEARSHLTQALSVVAGARIPAPAESHFLHGLLLGGRGESAEAAAAFGRALALRPGWLAALLHRGASYFALGDYVRAREDFRAAQEMVPPAGRAHFGEVASATKAESPSAGEGPAGARQPTGATVLYDLALADVMVGRWEEAQALFRTLASVDAANGPSYYELLAQTCRAQTEDSFYGQLHRLKNMMGMVGDRLRLFREDASNLLDPALRHALGELSTQYDLIYHDLVAFLGAVRREPLELDVVDVHQVLDGALVAALPEVSAPAPGAQPSRLGTGAPAPPPLVKGRSKESPPRRARAEKGKETAGGEALSAPSSLLSLALPASGGRVEVLKDYAGDLPSVVCDPALIREAFLNVILNALEAMQGEGVLSITTGRVVSGGEAEAPAPRPPDRRSRSTKSLPPKEREAAFGSEAQAGREEFVYVIFVDTGPGVAAEDAERIFHLGYSTKPFGSGIGLYQARRAVAVHGGHIEVTPGGPGGAFTIYLPCRPRLSPSIEDLSPKARLPEDARELIIEPAAAGEGDLLL